MLDEVKFNLERVPSSMVRQELTETFARFIKIHDGEIWSGELIEALYAYMEDTAKMFGYKLVNTLQNNILYVRVVLDETV